jgi:hypothetical protein
MPLLGMEQTKSPDLHLLRLPRGRGCPSAPSVPYQCHYVALACDKEARTSGWPSRSRRRGPARQPTRRVVVQSCVCAVDHGGCEELEERGGGF